MNLGPTSILQRALALISVPLIISTASYGARKVKEYENFALPKASHLAPSDSAVNYLGSRVQVKKGTPFFREGSFTAQQYIFAKEAFVAEKREEAIKLLRQELDSGFKRNKDNLLLRLGQLYAEKYMELSFHENELYTKSLADYEKQKAAKQQAEAPKFDNSRSRSYLKDALALFSTLEKDYPAHPRMDEIVFFIGFVNLETGNNEKGIRYLERLVRQYPKSRKFEEAVVYLGDVYFEKAKFKDALLKYRILSHRTDSALYDYAMYKTAWCELNTSEGARALSDLKNLIQRLEGNKDVAKFSLREQALKDLVVFYGELGRVDEAVAYFTEKVGRDKALENLRLIADILRSKARDSEAAKAYATLIREFPNAPETPRLVMGLNDSLSRIGKGSESVSRLVKALSEYNPGSDWFKQIPVDKKQVAQSAMDEMASDATRNAFFYHNSAQKSSNKSSYQFALEIYKALLEYFPNHPERKKIAFYRGEILFSQGKWLEASDSYMIAAQIAPKDKMADESAYAALLSLDRLTAKTDNLERFSKEEQKAVDPTPRPIPSGEQKFIEVARYYLKQYPEGNRVVDVKFRIAAIYYKYHHFDDAQNMFKEIALKTPRHRSATTAANIVLDIYNIKKDYANLDATAKMFAKVNGLGDAAFRAEMAQLSTEIDFKSVESLEASNNWEEAGKRYYNLYKSHPDSPLAEKALHNAFISFEKAGNNREAKEVSSLFILKFPKSEYTKQFTLNLAKLAEKQFDLDKAQNLYYEYSKKFPTDKEARKALYNSAVFAELLEKNKTALTLYDEYLKSKDTSAEERHAILISQAKLYRKNKQFDKMALIYRKLEREAKSSQEKLSYLGELAKNYELAGKISERDYVLKEIRFAYDANPNLKSLGPAIEYVAESKFRAIEKDRDKYEKIALRFPPEDLVYLIKRKQKLLMKLDKSYDDVVKVGVPEWGVAALYEKSQAFSNFTDAFRKLQIPAKYKGDERKEVESQLKVLEAKLVKPVDEKVQEILKSCMDRASQYFVANEYASKCRDDLKKDSKTPEPTGIFPQPSYWTTRWTGGSVANR